jgi:hypothetical protein
MDIFISSFANHSICCIQILNPLSFEFPLPSSNDQMTDLTLTGDVDGNTPIKLEISVEGDLVVLARRNSETVYIPVSRSYNAHDWERVAGPDATLQIECFAEASTRMCLLYIAPNQGDTYFLTKYNHIITDKERVARFLEMTTFGPTPTDLTSFDYGDIDHSMALAVQNEMSKPVGSHREFFRKRLTSRALETYKDHTSGPKPCDQFARWRRFAFTTKDAKMSNDYKAFDVIISSVVNGSDTGYVLSFQDDVRTVLDSPLQYYDERTPATTGTLPDGSYEICWVDDILGSTRNEVSIQSRYRCFVLCTKGRIESNLSSYSRHPTLPHQVSNFSSHRVLTFLAPERAGRLLAETRPFASTQGLSL